MLWRLWVGSGDIGFPPWRRQGCFRAVFEGGMRRAIPLPASLRSLGYSHHGQDMIALELADIEDLARRALIRAGASDEHADAVADVVMRAEQGECDDEPS